MFERLAHAICRAPWIAIAVWAVIAAVSVGVASVGVTGENLFDRLSTGAPAIPDSESDAAADKIADASTSGASLTLVVRDVDLDAALAGPVAEIRSEVAAVPGVASVIDPYLLPGGPADPAAAGLVALDGRGFLMVAELEHGLDPDLESTALAEVQTLLQAAPQRLAETAPGATGLVGGTSMIIDDIMDQVQADLRLGETVALPIALVIMILVFGGLLAAAMPLVGAIASIAVGLGGAYALTYAMNLDVSTVNVITILGLGLSIDYGLLIVSRYREELTRILDAGEGGRRRRGDGAVDEALRRTLTTAGRTVSFSGLIVAISISGLLVFSPEILRAFGAASVIVVLVAVTTALTLVPALLKLTGRRLVGRSVVERLPGFAWVLQRTGDVSSSEGVFSRLAGRVQRHPWLILLGCLALLGVLASPVAGLQMRNSTVELLPPASSQRDFLAAVGEQFPAAAAAPVQVVAAGTLEEVTAWSAEIAAVDGVAAVDPAVPLGSHVFLGVRLAAADPGGQEATDVVHAIRALDPGFDTWVGGQAANQLDFIEALGQDVWWAVGIVAMATFVLLFLMTGSVLIPVKALLTNVVSMSAALGVLVWGFQEGHLEGALGFTSSGGIETYVVALVVAFGFGLAMDYEVFLLSRIKEMHDSGHDDDAAVRLGLQRSGRIITSAAVIIVVVFAGFMLGELLVIKQVGFALAVAVTIDATIVRMLLVPATMTLLGRWNWWAPKPLRAVYRRLGIAH